MHQLINLSLQRILIDEFPLKNSFVDLEKIKFNALKNYWGEYRKINNKNDYRYNYFNVTDDKNITWIIDYFRNNYRLQEKKYVLKPQYSFLIQETNEIIETHNEIIPTDLENSPDTSVIYTVDCGEKPVDIIFETKFKGVLPQKIRVPMKKNNYIIFNSSLKRSFAVNENKKPLINLHFSFFEKDI